MTLDDQRAVPTGAVLLGPGYQLTGAHPGLATCVDEDHQREQAHDLGLVGQQLAQDAGQPDRLAGELGAHRLAVAGGEVALVEDQEENGQDAGEALGEVGGSGTR